MRLSGLAGGLAVVAMVAGGLAVVAMVAGGLAVVAMVAGALVMARPAQAVGTRPTTATAR